MTAVLGNPAHGAAGYRRERRYLEASFVAQPGQRPTRTVAAPAGPLRRRPCQPVEHPAAVFLLLGLHGVEVSLDLGISDQAARSAVRTGGEAERAQRLPLDAAHGRDRGWV